jgi:N-acetylglucosaminyldiphosphoundecaprenol N-acetyl-beta-D-mannosaminyltransferase
VSIPAICEPVGSEPPALIPAPRPASSIFDIPIDLGQPDELLRTVSGWAGGGQSRRVMYVNAHVVNQSRVTPGLSSALRRADLVYCDGYGVRLAARALHTQVPYRMTGADWIWTLAALCQVSGHSLYLLGSEPPIAQRAAARLRRWYPQLSVAGAHHGFFGIDSPHNDRVLEDIRERSPQIVLVGMGSPKQELWVDRYADQLGGAVVWTVGALFDYVSGHIPRAPHWLADNGLEWIFRLAIEPRRMWRRYLIGNPVFLSRVLAESRNPAITRVGPAVEPSAEALLGDDAAGGPTPIAALD